MRQNIFAYTSPGGLSPEYISVKKAVLGAAIETIAIKSPTAVK